MIPPRKAEPGSGRASSPEPVAGTPAAPKPAHPDASKFAVPREFGGELNPAVELTELRKAMRDPLTSKYDLQLGRETTIVYVGKKSPHRVGRKPPEASSGKRR